MAFSLSEELVRKLEALDPKVSRTGVPDAAFALDALIEAEEARRGYPDRISGAFHAMALTQGALIKAEYDLSTHAHHDAWEIGAVVVDLQRTIALNMRYGFEVGDQALRAIVHGLQTLFPTGKTVRIHTDAFAVLLPPSAERPVTEVARTLVESNLPGAVRSVLPDDGDPPEPLNFTVALLRLRIRSPSHWQVLGPIVWAECERVLTETRLGRTGIATRLIPLDGQVVDER
ncbi:MAG: GGDEF domain-containing protein [Myxococcota bacterium]|nr:GGDEF domain-containing protein [Myxococcota bacterium]